MKTLHRITMYRVKSGSLLAFVAYDNKDMKSPTYRSIDFERMMNDITPLIDMALPRHGYYWRVLHRTKGNSIRIRRVGLVRNISLVPNHPDPYMLWPEAFEAWLAYARML